MGSIKIVVVDDHLGVGEALAMFLGERNVADVLGIAQTVKEGLQLCTRFSPDLVIVDLVLSDGSGVDLLREIRSSGSETKSLVYSGCFKEAIILGALSQFPNGYVNKSAPMDTLIRAIQAICLQGEMFFCPVVARFIKLTHGRCKVLAQKLSERDQRVLELIVAGAPSKAIADRMGMSQRSVDTCRARIMASMGTVDVASLTRVAISAGLVPEDRLFLPGELRPEPGLQLQ